MKTILFWLFIAAIAFGVYKCMDDNSGDKDNTAAESYNIEYVDSTVHGSQDEERYVTIKGTNNTKINKKEIINTQNIISNVNERSSNELEEKAKQLNQKLPISLYDDNVIESILYLKDNRNLRVTIHIEGKIKDQYTTDEQLHEVAKNALYMLTAVSKNFSIENFAELLDENKVTYGVRFIDDNGFDKYSDVLFWQ